MKALARHLPTALIAGVSAAACWHGPIAQLPDYHAFADQTARLGIPHFADVVSNLGFAAVALAGWMGLARAGSARSQGPGWTGYRLFLVSLFLTALGSAWYHLAPDNARLVWDRLPIALACAGLLAGVWGDTHGRESGRLTLALAVFAMLSVGWWYGTEAAGLGDLRPYLLLQAAPVLLIPVWQWLHGSAPDERLAFGMALLLYVAAKVAELYDHEIGAILGDLTGHTVKHLLATVAAGLIVWRLQRRVSQAALPDDGLAVWASR